MIRIAQKCVLQVAAAIAVCGLLAGEFEPANAAAQRKPAAKKHTNKKPKGGGTNGNKGGNRGGGVGAAQKKALTSRAKAADAAIKRTIGPVQAAKNAHDKAERDLKTARDRVASVEEYLVSTASADTPLGKARLAYHDAKDDYDKIKAEVLAGLDSPDAAARIRTVAEDPKIQEAKRRVSAAATPMRKEREKLLASNDKWTMAKNQVKMLSSAERTAEREWKSRISVYNKAKMAATAVRKAISSVQTPSGGQGGRKPGGKGTGQGARNKGGNKHAGGKKKVARRR